jgi:hypothetical protein
MGSPGHGILTSRTGGDFPMERGVPNPLPQDPIFIVGYPRSGTTLLQAMLATQPGIRTLPETHFFSMVLRRLGGEATLPISADSLPEAWKIIREKTGVDFAPGQRERLEAASRAGRLTAKDLFEHLVGHLLQEREVDKSRKVTFRWLEKTPNHAYFLDQILVCYPRFRAVNIIRHPVAAVLSRQKSFPFNAGTPVSDLAAQWVRSIRAADDFAHGHPEAILSVRYEDLVEDPEGIMGRICEFLSLQLDVPELAEYRSVAETVIQPGETWKQGVLEPLRNTNARYLRDAALRDTLRIQSVTGACMTRLQYPLLHPWIQFCYDRLWSRTIPPSGTPSADHAVSRER